MAMIYFGEPWDAPAVDDGIAGETPIGERCIQCGEIVAEGDQGFMVPSVRLGDDGSTPVSSLEPNHRECLLLAVVGDVAHLEGRCHCYGGTVEHAEDGSAFRARGWETLEWLRRHGSSGRPFVIDD